MLSVKHFLRTYRWLIAAVFVAGVAVLLGPWTYANLSTLSQRFDSARVAASDVPAHRVAIVFGARVIDGAPSPYLFYRVQAAVKLYKAGTVKKLLMTGDNSLKTYDEPMVMKLTAIAMGVKPGDITVDDAGFSTYDSCYRAKHVFGLDSAVLVSQSYHLPRALMTCDALGVTSVGYGAKQPEPLLVAQYTMREWLSSDKIVVQLATGAKAKFVGEPIPIR